MFNHKRLHLFRCFKRSHLFTASASFIAALGVLNVLPQPDVCRMKKLT